MSWLDQALREGPRAILGLSGTTEINTTAVHVGRWCYIMPQEDTVFTTLTDANRDGDALGAEVCAKGIGMPGDFSVITLASGRVTAYKYPKGDGAAA